MDITVKARCTPSIRGNGYITSILINDRQVLQPIHNFRRSLNGGRNLANACANKYAEGMRKFGNKVTVIPA